MFSHLGWQDGTTCRALTMGMMVRMMMAMMFVKKTTDVSIPRGNRQHQQSARIIISSNIGPVALIILYLLYQTSYTWSTNHIYIIYHQQSARIIIISSNIGPHYISYIPSYSVYLVNSPSPKQNFFALSLSFRILDQETFCPDQMVVCVCLLKGLRPAAHISYSKDILRIRIKVCIMLTIT